VSWPKHRSSLFTKNDARDCFFGVVVQKKSKGLRLSHCRASSCILFDKRCYKIFFLSSQPTSSNTSTQTNFPSRGVARTTVQAKDTNPKTFFQLANQQADEEVSAETAVLAVDRLPDRYPDPSMIWVTEHATQVMQFPNFDL
jgi:hypothetical protein